MTLQPVVLVNGGVMVSVRRYPVIPTSSVAVKVVMESTKVLLVVGTINTVMFGTVENEVPLKVF